MCITSLVLDTGKSSCIMFQASIHKHMLCRYVQDLGGGDMYVEGGVWPY